MELKYFTEDEINFVSFGCEDGYDRMDKEALRAFDNLRHELGFSLTPTCAFRTVEYDKAQGRSGNSQHTKGLAMDFFCTKHSKAIKIMTKAYELGFKGIAYNPDENFVHIDMRDSDTLITWDY